MALLIYGWANEEFEREPGVFQWHLGEPVPNMSRVVEFKADGDELNLFVNAMEASRRAMPSGIYYSKGMGFQKERT